MSLSKFLTQFVVFSVCAVFFVSAADAQYRASIQGVVTDPQGAVPTTSTAPTSARLRTLLQAVSSR